MKKLFRKKNRKKTGLIPSALKGAAFGFAFIIIAGLLLSAFGMNTENPIKNTNVLAYIASGIGGVLCGMISAKNYSGKRIAASMSSALIMCLCVFLIAITTKSVSGEITRFIPIAIITASSFVGGILAN